MTDPATSVDMPKAPATQRASRRRAAADATNRWREKRRKQGMPEVALVDRAIAEATTFCMQPAYAVSDTDGIYISITRLFRVAVLALVRNGADRDFASKAVKERLLPREGHDSVSHVPSLNMHAPNFRPAPRRHDLPWSEADRRAMTAASRPREITQYVGVTGVHSKSDDHSVRE